VPADSNAAYLNNPKPEYPLLARQRHWQGTVLLRVYVGANGQAQSVAVARSSGHEVLDESALEAVREWRFVPAKRGDIAEASWATVPIVFELD
jgi:periplasmic protein TonB